ncbi:MAG TPA: hypothetical protein VGE24_06190, partial [Emticicia sp.]
GNQNQYRNLTSLYNGAGFAFSIARFKVDGNIIGHDDNLHHRLFATDNNWGALYIGYNTTVAERCTYQHNALGNLSIIDCGRLTFDMLYNEVGDNWVSQDLEDYPLIFVSGNGIKLDIHTPQNLGIGFWYRAIESNALDLTIRLSGHNNRANTADNPNHPGDYSLVRMVTGNYTQHPSLRLYLSNYTNLQSLGGLHLAVVNDLYNFPENNCIVESVIWNEGWATSVGTRRFLDKTLYQTGSEEFARIEINPDGTEIGFGPGDSASPDVRIKRFDVGVAGTPHHWQVNGTLNLRKPNGTGLFIWSNNSNRLRFGTSMPTDRDVDGTEISVLKKLTVTQTIDFGNVLANDELAAPSTVTLTGASVGDEVIIQPSSNTAGITYKGFVTSSNIVTLYAVNSKASDVDPGSMNFKVSIIK